MLVELLSGPMDGLIMDLEPSDLVGTEYIYIDRKPENLCTLPIEKQGKRLPLRTSVYRIKLGKDKHKATYSHYEDEEEFNE